MKLSRKQFLATAALGMAGSAVAAAGQTLGGKIQTSGGCAPTPVPHPHFHILRENEYDHAGMIKTAQASFPHRQVFVSTGVDAIMPGIASVYFHMVNSLNAFEFGFGYGKGSLGTLGVLMGSAVLLALNDSMWSKYPFGPSMNLKGADGMPALKNVYYPPMSGLNPSAAPDDPNGFYQDFSGRAVLARGGKFWVCHNALTGQAMRFSKKMKMPMEEVLADWKKNFLPGYQWIPAGVGGAQLAQDYGWKIFQVGG